MSKRIIAILMTAAMLFSLAACSGGATESIITSEYYVVEGDETDANAASIDATDTSGTASSGSSSKTSGSSSKNSGGNAASIVDTTKITTVDGLDFGGKAVKIAITNDKTPTESDKRMFADFEKAYNCKIKYEIIPFNDYLKTVGNKISSNQPYDILYLHGSMFPAAVISRLAVPLDSAIYDKDKLNKNNISAGGIDMDKSSYYTWKDKIYGVAGYDDINIFFLYYNKQKFKDSGLEDPLTLYNSGNWTWDKLIEMGKAVTDKNQDRYFGDFSFTSQAIVLSYGGKWINKKSYKDVKENTSDPHIFNGLKMLQRMCDGSEQIINRGKGQSDASEFLSGRTYAYLAEDIRYSSQISKGIINDKKLGGNIDNVGSVPVPLGDGNTAYPAGWITGIAACRGTQDITMAVAFAKFRTTWKDSKSDPYKLPESAQQLRSKLLSNLNYKNYGYTTSGTDTKATIDSIVQQINAKVSGGKDIKSTLDAYKGSIQNCIDVSLKK